MVFGEIEKKLCRLIHAENQDDAERNALLSECNNEIGSGADMADGGVYDNHGEVHYSIKKCVVVNASQVELMSQFL
jgi:hypothetical protein